MKQVFIGTSGYNYSSWKGKFYPEGLASKEWLNFFSQKFQTVEINATFYRSFSQKTYRNWYLKTPPGFCFTIKGPKVITHLKKLKEIDQELDLFLESASGLKEKLATILWQFPKSFKATDDNIIKLETFLNLLPKKGPKSVVELRDDSWFNKDIYKLLDKYKAGFVINQTTAFPTAEAVTGGVVYIRFHGPNSLYASSYSDKDLDLWAKKIKKYSQENPVYIYFNNDMSGYAVANAQTLEKLLK